MNHASTQGAKPTLTDNSMEQDGKMVSAGTFQSIGGLAAAQIAHQRRKTTNGKLITTTFDVGEEPTHNQGWPAVDIATTLVGRLVD